MTSASKIYFRHDKFRSHQKEIVEDAYETISNGQHFMVHAPTGCGKSDSLLSPALTYALENNLSIFFLTPKISQHKIAIDVLQGIAKKFDLGLRAVDLIGRRYACIDPILTDLDHDSFYQSCEKKRKNEECVFCRNAKGFSKLDQARANRLFEKLLEEYGTAKTHGEVMEIGEKSAACPYELLMRLAGVSNVLIADYYHLMIPQIRDILLLKTKKKLEKSIIIVDEAHNLAKRVREHLSSATNSFVLGRVEKEIRAIGAEPISISDEFDLWAKRELIDKQELLISKKDFDEFLFSYNSELIQLVQYFEDIGLEFIERTNRKSACLRFAKFLKSWSTDDKGTIRILRKRGEYFTLSRRFLDPSVVTSALNQAHSTVLMSGTLLPLEMHRDIIGLDEKRTVMKRYPSPFDEKNTLSIISEGTTTKYSKRTFENYSEIARRIDLIIGASPDAVAVFFPSYSVMNPVVPLLKSKKLILQQEKTTPRETAELLKRFGSGGVLCAVQGGSFSEGIDYCKGEIKTVIVVGIALEEPSLETTALIDYYQDKFGKGWEYGYTYPAIIKALQAAGRGIRKESDRAAIVFMDERFKWKNYRSVLDDGRRFIITNEPEKYVKLFWENHPC